MTCGCFLRMTSDFCNSLSSLNAYWMVPVMTCSEQWLREWCNPPVGCEEIVQKLNSLGREVDSAQPVAPPFSGVVVAQIKSLQPHPDADRLRICRVDTGNGE